MSSPYLSNLIRFAREDLPTLEADAESAGSNSYNMRDCFLKLLQITKYLLHHVVIESSSVPGKTTAPPPRPAAPPPPPRPASAPHHAIHGMDFLPPIDSPRPQAPSLLPANIPGDVPVQPGVTNVVITPQGTTAISPRGIRSVLPAGQAVPLEASADVDPEPPPAPEGVAQVVLPPGGGMSPELAAALSGRSQDQPPEPAKE